MEMYIDKSTDSFYYAEEIDIFDHLIEDGILFDTEFFNHTSANYLAIYTIELSEISDLTRILMSDLTRILMCRGEKSTNEDELTANSVFYQLASSILVELENIEENICKIVTPIRINGMFLVTGVMKYGDMVSMIFAKTESDAIEKLAITCTGICGLLYTMLIVLTAGEENIEVPIVTVEKIIEPDESRMIRKALCSWFDNEPPVVEAWVKRLEEEQKKQHHQQDDEEE